MLPYFAMHAPPAPKEYAYLGPMRPKPSVPQPPPDWSREEREEWISDPDEFLHPRVREHAERVAAANEAREAWRQEFLVKREVAWRIEFARAMVAAIRQEVTITEEDAR